MKLADFLELSELLELSEWIIPLLLILVPLYAMLHGVEIYSVFCRGAADGIRVLWQILPGLLGMMIAVGALVNSGALLLAADWLSPVLIKWGIPVEVLPLGLIRSFSGSGALGYTAGLIEQYGADSFIGRLAAVMQGSTDTTFYILAVYFGSVGIVRYRYAVFAGLLADMAAFVAAFVFVRSVWG